MIDDIQTRSIADSRRNKAMHAGCNALSSRYDVSQIDDGANLTRCGLGSTLAAFDDAVWGCTCQPDDHAYSPADLRLLPKTRVEAPRQRSALLGRGRCATLAPFERPSCPAAEDPELKSQLAVSHVTDSYE